MIVTRITDYPSEVIGGCPHIPHSHALFTNDFTHLVEARMNKPQFDDSLFPVVPGRELIPDGEVVNQKPKNGLRFELGRVYVVLQDDGRFLAAVYHAMLDIQLTYTFKVFKFQALTSKLIIEQLPIFSTVNSHILFRTKELMLCILSYDVSVHEGCFASRQMLNTAQAAITKMIQLGPFVDPDRLLECHDEITLPDK